LVLNLKYPRSDFRQKIKLISTNPEPIKRELISRGSYEQFSYKFTNIRGSLEIITIFNAQIIERRFRMSKAMFPIETQNDFLNYYLQPTDFVESNNSEICEISENLTALTKRLSDSIDRLVRYFNSYFKYDLQLVNKRQTALETLHTQGGSCEDINHLFNALCRAIGIPCRLALGFSKGVKGWGRHVWSEIYDPQFGWFPIDLLYNPPQIGYIDSSHLKLLTALDCSESEIRVEYEYPIDSQSPLIIIDHYLFIDKISIPVHIEIKQ